MKPLFIKYDQARFWKDYWLKFDLDREEFINLKMYPIDVTLRYLKKQDRILECGFGAGRVIRHLHKHGYNVEGIEYDGGIVDKLKNLDKTLKIQQADIKELPFPDNYFDSVLCFGVIGGLKDDLGRAVGELKRVAKTGGTIILSVMLDNVARLAHRIGCALINRGTPAQFYAWMDSAAGWKKYFESLGFEIIDCRPVVLKYNLYYWTKLLRSGDNVDLALSRVDDNELKFNSLGKIFWFLHRNFFKKQFASGITFVLRNSKQPAI